MIELYAAAKILSRKEAGNEPARAPFGKAKRGDGVLSGMRFPLLALVCAALALSPSMHGQSASATPPAGDYSGAYSFLRDGEFVQLTVEGEKVTGFISRFGDSEADKGVFLNQFFKSGKLEGDKLSFTTDQVHGIWFEFSGNVVRGEAKTPADEGYYVLRGTLTRFNTDSEKKTTSQARSVELKSFPRDTATN